MSLVKTTVESGKKKKHEVKEETRVVQRTRKLETLGSEYGVIRCGEFNAFGILLLHLGFLFDEMSVLN